MPGGSSRSCCSRCRIASPLELYIPIQFDPGDPPLSGGIMCDIPKSVELGANGECADETDIASGIAIAHAAVALAEGVSSSILLDFSNSATMACGGAPKARQMQGPFPDGLALCLNCGQQIPADTPTRPKCASPSASTWWNKAASRRRKARRPFARATRGSARTSTRAPVSMGSAPMAERSSRTSSIRGASRKRSRGSTSAETQARWTTT